MAIQTFFAATKKRSNSKTWSHFPPQRPTTRSWKRVTVALSYEFCTSVMVLRWVLWCLGWLKGGGALLDVASTRDIKQQKTLACGFWVRNSRPLGAISEKCHQTTTTHLIQPPWKLRCRLKRDHFKRKNGLPTGIFAEDMFVLFRFQVCFFGGMPSPRPSEIPVFHRKLFKNNIDDSGAEGIAQLCQSCPGIEDGRKTKFRDDGLCGGCCLGMCWGYYMCCVVVLVFFNVEWELFGGATVSIFKVGCLRSDLRMPTILRFSMGESANG